MANNLFDFATSELSQDAFLCWLVNWINNRKDNEYLYKTARLLLDRFFDLSDIDKPPEYTSVVIKQQYEKIDILLIINKKYVVIIEDKTYTENHSYQLSRYIDTVKQKRGEEDIPTEYELLPIYFKTGNQSNFQNVKEKGYSLLLRKDFIEVLNKYSNKINNQIFIDFHNFILEIESNTNSYINEKVKDWDWWSWQGFLMHVYDNFATEDDKKEAWNNWKYINNPRGGFWGYFFNWLEIEKDVWIYIQLELEAGEDTNKRICLKVEVDSENLKNRRKEIRGRLYEISKRIGPQNGNKPNFRTGHYMTFWISTNKLFDDINQKVDITSVVTKIKQSQELLTAIAKEYMST